MENEQFHSDIDKIFESYLKQGEKPVIRITQNGRILANMPYEKVLFDSELNIYKRTAEGGLERIDNPEFVAVVISQ